MEIGKLTNAMKILLENQKNFIEKNIDDTQLFDYKDGEYEFDESLLKKEGFIEKLLSNEKNSLTKEQLSTLYDAVASLDNKEGMTKGEIETFASYANAFDQIDPNGKTINELDIAEFLKNLEETDALEEVEDEVCQTCPDDCDCGCKDPEIFNSVETVSSVFKADDRIKTDDNGQKYVTVEAWEKGNNTNNDCLSRIINNSYDLDAMGIKLYSEEYYELEKAVMDANPEIYGTEDGGGRKRIINGERNNSIIYTGDKIVLPDFDYEKKFECECEPTAPAQQATPQPDVTVTEGGATVTVTQPDVTVTEGGATVTVTQPDVTVTEGGVTVTVTQPDVTVTESGATVTVTQPDVTVTESGATVTVTQPDVTVTESGATVTVTQPDVTVTESGATVTVTQPDVTVTESGATVTVTQPDVTVTEGGATVTVTQPDVTVEEGGATVTVSKPDVTVEEGGATVTVTQPDVTVTQPGATVTVTEPDVTVTKPGATVTVTEPDVTITIPDTGSDIPIVQPSDIEYPDLPTEPTYCEPMPDIEYEEEEKPKLP